ncbi:hypothetical protein D6C98_07873 [Aureobasidium pullulans]|nr:hypothetical protein D6C98_07873 [Aureobasidium pullulans]
MSYIAEYVFDYGQLKSTFVCALEHWKPQTISFLELPPEIRNMIYNLLVQQELLPLYFSIITPHLRMSSRDGLRTRTFDYAFQAEVVVWLDRKGPDAVDYFHAIFLRSFGLPYVDCSIKIHKPMVVEARVRSCKMYEGCEGLEASTNQTLAEKITESLKLSNTGLLGLRHFELAEEVIDQLQRKIESLSANKL